MTDKTSAQQPEKIEDRFARETASHQMTVLRDDGLYRHLRFRRPDTGFYWFDLITWPGSLAVHGDCGSYLFSRDTDMFQFFRGRGINPDYWAEKVPASSRDSLSRYSEDRFRELVTEELALDDRGKGPEADWPGVTEAALDEIFGDNSRWYAYAEDGARAALDEFEFGATWMATCTCGSARGGFGSDEDAQRWCRTHVPGALGSSVHVARDVTKFDGFTFSDTAEWDLRDWDWQYLWCCHAIVWGIARYDQHKAALTAPWAWAVAELEAEPVLLAGVPA